MGDFDFDCTDRFCDLYSQPFDDHNDENSDRQSSSVNANSTDSWFETHHPLHEIQDHSSTIEDLASDDCVGMSTKSIESKKDSSDANLRGHAKLASRRVMAPSCAAKSTTSSRKRSISTVISADATNNEVGEDAYPRKRAPCSTIRSTATGGVSSNATEIAVVPGPASKRAAAITSSKKVFLEPTRKPLAKSKIYTGTTRGKGNSKNAGPAATTTRPMQSAQQAALQRRLEKERKLMEDEALSIMGSTSVGSTAGTTRFAAPAPAPAPVVEQSVKATRAWGKRTGK